MINYLNLTGTKIIFEKKKLNDWIKYTVNNEGKIIGDIQYIFCDDDYLLDVNKKFLQHDYYTDIVTFPLSENSNVISGEIYISLDRVAENAILNNTDFDNELARVVIHGVLHLLGYDDHSDNEKKEMRKKEDYYLNLLFKK